METALAGVRVVDLTRALAGPYGSMILGDLGAEIIKIEATDARREATGPYSYKGQDSYSMSANRSKKSITLDIRTEKGRHILYELVKISDVVYDNFRPGVVERLRVDYDTLKEINPRIICCSVSGFGSRGPYRNLTAYDVNLQALCGLMSITGEPGRPPVRAGCAISDEGAGMFAVIGILAALHARERTGVGQKVETSLLEATIALQAPESAMYLVSGIVPTPLGSGHRTIPIFNAFQTKDGYITIAAIGTFPALCKALGREDLMQDPRFAGRQMSEHREELLTTLQETLLTKKSDEWLRLLREADVPCAPVNTLDKALSDPQVLAMDMVVSVDHTLGGQIKQTGNPIKMSATPPELRTKFVSPPVVGEHTDEILSQLLGYSKENIDQLRQEKLI